MKGDEIVATLGGMVVLVASTAAAIAIRVVLTAPTTVAGVMDGHADEPLRALARALYEVAARLVQYL